MAAIISVHILVAGITGLSIVGVSTFVQDLFYGGAARDRREAVANCTRQRREDGVTSAGARRVLLALKGDVKRFGQPLKDEVFSVTGTVDDNEVALAIKGDQRMVPDVAPVVDTLAG